MGLTDFAAVVGEPYRQWVIEDRFAGPRPAWERAGVRFVSDIGPHQKAKLRLVNGTHSALALLAGFESTAEVVARPEFAAFVVRLVREETGRGMHADPAALLARFANPRITHRLAQIGADGPHKLPQRLLAPAAEIIAAGGEPRLICLALAGFLRHHQLSTLDFLPYALRESKVFDDLMTYALARLESDGVLATLRRL